ncbi:MAG: hypothetical protein JWM95_1808 [Gemmatimonadetes bacterium]|nr:hypothetical protein [Gemmatimonadota bacterium]
MTINPNDEGRNFGPDRERQREVSDESGRSARVAGASDAGSAPRGRSNRGFASMDQGKQREIASKGGRAAHQKGTAHEFDASEARSAGRKGGVTVSKNREHMAAIGRRGGEARGANRAARLQSQNAGTSAAPIQADREVGFADSPPPQRASNTEAQRPARNQMDSVERPAT